MIKVGIVGPESTGKSAIAAFLAAQYGTVWAAEFARDYLSDRKGVYEYETLDEILDGQLNEEAKAVAKGVALVFIDTTPLVIKIWSEVVFGRVSDKVIRAHNSTHYDFLLLMDIDLPWEPDPLREHPEKRAFLFDLYHKEVAACGIPYRIISGTGKKREENALAACCDIDKIRLLSHRIQAKHL